MEVRVVSLEVGLHFARLQVLDTHSSCVLFFALIASVLTIKTNPAMKFSAVATRVWRPRHRLFPLLWRVVWSVSLLGPVLGILPKVLPPLSL